MSDMTREQYETLALDRLAELARSENERIALEAARTMLAHLRLTSPQRENGNRGLTQIGADASSDRGGAHEVSPMDVSAEDNLRSSASIRGSHCGSQDPDIEKAREHVLAAMDRCAGLLDHENPFVVLRAAREILQHYRHLCRERFKWVAWSDVVERRDKKRRGAAALAKVKGLGRELAGIRKAAYREESGAESWEEESEGAEEYRVCPPPPIDWDATQDGPSGPHEGGDEAEDAPPHPDERAPP